MLTREGELKLINFKIAKRFKKGEVLECKDLDDRHRRPEFQAPEAFRGAFDSKCDLWSVGCILYAAMSGYLPFQDDNTTEFHYDLVERIKLGEFNLERPEFEKCSEHVIDLIKKLLEKDPKKRYSAEQALLHPWFKE